MNVKELDGKYIANTYKRFPVQIVSGRGSLFYDEAGKEYIDLGSGIGVTSFGACDEAWQNAVKEQIGKVQHTSNLYYTEPCVLLAQMLCEKTGFKKVFFGNSGAEANECAIKVARKYAAEKKGKDVYKIITLENSFHGRTLTTLAATGQEHYHELFTPLTPGFIHVKASEPGALSQLCEKGDVAAVMIECIQGEGGVVPITQAFADEVKKVTREKDILLIVDEVQTGNGRTGKLYSYMHYGLSPDIVSTAKGLAGGLPLGAALLSEKVESVLTFGDHGSTFGANPVCCAAALSVLSRLDDKFIKEVAEKGEYLKKTFAGAKGIEDVSGLGLMLGLKTEKPAGEVVSACMEKGVLCLTAKDRVRLLPALNIDMKLLEKAADIIKAVCAEGDK
ncbi:MAG: acetylornithine/succinylornithine family transaminase [Clostridia bacterium]|nr:acetylornithine/succinylornithine family transaminase [Clostridia bacterium]